MHQLRCSAIVALLLLNAGCAKPEYWVKGLTLPPGATVTEKSETATSGDAAAPGSDAKSLRVTFECQGGIDKVAAHIWQCLSVQGFKQVDEMGMSGIDMKGFDKFLKSMKSYENSAKGQYVTLQAMGALLAGLDLSKLGGDNKMADTYVLMVMTDK